MKVQILLEAIFFNPPTACFNRKIGVYVKSCDKIEIIRWRKNWGEKKENTLIENKIVTCLMCI